MIVMLITVMVRNLTLVKIDCTVEPLVKSERPLLVVDFPLQCDDDARDL